MWASLPRGPSGCYSPAFGPSWNSLCQVRLPWSGPVSAVYVLFLLFAPGVLLGFTLGGAGGTVFFFFLILAVVTVGG